MQKFCISSTGQRQRRSCLGGNYAGSDGLRDVCRLTRGAAQRKDQPPHPLRQASDDRLVEHWGRCACRAAQSRQWADRLDAEGKDGVPPRQRTAGLQRGATSWSFREVRSTRPGFAKIPRWSISSPRPAPNSYSAANPLTWAKIVRPAASLADEYHPEDPPVG